MSNRPAPPDQQQRLAALDASRSMLVRAPAGSGKTDLLTRRYLRLLAEVDEPGQIVAITFTLAAAAEMRHRILGELEKAATHLGEPLPEDCFSMEALASRALAHARRRGWKLLHTPSLLRIQTIDAFCRDLALQQPMLSGLGGGLEIHPQPAELYRRAARRTLEELGNPAAANEFRLAIEQLLRWRDNNWPELENLLVTMLAGRDRWMQGFVLGQQIDEALLRERLERPLAQAVGKELASVASLLNGLSGAEQEILALARFACDQLAPDKREPLLPLAELAELPDGAAESPEALQAAQAALQALADFLLTLDGAFRRSVNKSNGFPADRKREKERFEALVEQLKTVDGLEAALDGLRALPPVRYRDAEWSIVRACFALLRHAVGELHVAFAEAGAVDFVQIAQIAEQALESPDGLPSDAAIAVADGIRHLLVDEFQDTSRRQHQLLSKLIAAWPEREGRSCFAVGDPMQSIYFFRDADAELFPRVQHYGLELPNGDALALDYTPLQANFRTAPELVERLNALFPPVFAALDGSQVVFAAAIPAREPAVTASPRFALHTKFEPYAAPNRAKLVADERALIRQQQIGEMVVIAAERLESARAHNERCRIAFLGRTRADLAPIAKALRAAAIPFRAVDLENLSDRPEIGDALALARAVANPFDRVAWLGVLRAPWCGLTLAALHALTGGDEAQALARPIAEVAAERLDRLTGEERASAGRTLAALARARANRASFPAQSLGAWLESLWTALGGSLCVDATGRANLDLLWSTLDRLPYGELDLNEAALEAAIAKLTALPDPAADPERGVQLMTIHKSKGLEFEIVLVPELQTTMPRSSYKLLSWLERGLPEPDESGEITEFLIAPLQPKGAERSSAKSWVDRVTRQRERQELRRILYVAATRAREELHLFTRCAYRQSSSGELQLATPSESLLATAWPAFDAEIRARFADWAAQQYASRHDAEIESLAAEADNLAVMPTPASSSPASAPLLRLPASLHASREEKAGLAHLAPASATPLQEPLFARHEGGAASRALGVAVHTLLEELPRLRLTLDWHAASVALGQYEPRLHAQIRSCGLDPTQAKRLAGEALAIARQAASDPTAQWALGPRSQAQNELSWTGRFGNLLRTVRVDRIFQAGSAPGEENGSCWWIVDYKTAYAEEEPEAARVRLRRLFAPQLESYAAMLRKLHGADAPICAALYYPRMSLFDWWKCE